MGNCLPGARLEKVVATVGASPTGCSTSLVPLNTVTRAPARAGSTHSVAFATAWMC